LEFYLINLIS